MSITAGGVAVEFSIINETTKVEFFLRQMPRRVVVLMVVEAGWGGGGGGGGVKATGISPQYVLDAA